MATKTYLIQMNLKCSNLLRYLTRYRDKYYPDMTPAQKGDVDFLIDALNALLLEIPLPDPLPNAP